MPTPISSTFNPRAALELCEVEDVGLQRVSRTRMCVEIFLAFEVASAAGIGVPELSDFLFLRCDRIHDGGRQRFSNTSIAAALPTTILELRSVEPCSRGRRQSRMLRASLLPMPKLEDSRQLRAERSAALLPVTVIVAARNEARNLPRCLESLRNAGEVYVVDSQSTDATVQIAQSYGAHVVQFHYQGGWPKKRQWAMESLPLAYDWIFLVDADEALTPELADEIQHAVQDPARDGYYIALRMFFLGRRAAP